MVSGLTFKSLIHFEFIFVYGEKVVQFDSVVCSCPVFPTPFIDEVYSGLLCHRLTAHIYVGSFLGSLF